MSAGCAHVEGLGRDEAVLGALQLLVEDEAGDDVDVDGGEGAAEWGGGERAGLGPEAGEGAEDALGGGEALPHGVGPALGGEEGGARVAVRVGGSAHEAGAERVEEEGGGAVAGQR